MHIGLLSDTHVPEAAGALPAEVAVAFRGVDLILHAGDVYVPSVLDELERIAPVLVARGDDDGGAMLSDSRLKWKHVLKIEGHTLWLLHDMPYARMVTPWQNAGLSQGGRQDIPDIVVFGHDHCTILERRHNVLYVNPGSPTFLNYQKGLGTVAILDVSPSHAEAHIVSLSH
jgi:putative phosphoesterase